MRSKLSNNFINIVEEIEKISIKPVSFYTRNNQKVTL